MINSDENTRGISEQSGIIAPAPEEALTGLNVFSARVSDPVNSPSVEEAAAADPVGAIAALFSYGEVTGFLTGGIPVIPVGKGPERWLPAIKRASIAQLGECWKRLEGREWHRAHHRVAQSQREDMPVLQWTDSGSGLEPGVYRAKITEIIEEDGQFGPQFRFQFKTLDADGAESDGEIRGWCSQKWGPKTKLFEWARAILRAKCPTVGQPFDSDSLLNKKADIEVVSYRKTDGGDGTKIDRLYPYATMSAQGEDAA